MNILFKVFSWESFNKLPKKDTNKPNQQTSLKELPMSRDHRVSLRHQRSRVASHSESQSAGEWRISSLGLIGGSQAMLVLAFEVFF